MDRLGAAAKSGRLSSAQMEAAKEAIDGPGGPDDEEMAQMSIAQRRKIAERRKRHLDARPNRSVYDYSTARWMYKHHGTRMLARLGQGADNKRKEARLRLEVQDIFRSLDDDGSGTLEPDEIKEVMDKHGFYGRQAEEIQEAFLRAVGVDGEIDFDVFYSVMKTVAGVDQTFFALDDETNARGSNTGFYTFANSVRRSQIIESIEQNGHGIKNYKRFHQLFDVHTLPRDKDPDREQDAADAEERKLVEELAEADALAPPHTFGYNLRPSATHRLMNPLKGVPGKGGGRLPSLEDYFPVDKDKQEKLDKKAAKRRSSGYGQAGGGGGKSASAAVIATTEVHTGAHHMSADEHAAMHAAELADGAEMVIRSIGGVVPPGAPAHLRGVRYAPMPAMGRGPNSPAPSWADDRMDATFEALGGDPRLLEQAHAESLRAAKAVSFASGSGTPAAAMAATDPFRHLRQEEHQQQRRGSGRGGILAQGSATQRGGRGRWGNKARPKKWWNHLSKRPRRPEDGAAGERARTRHALRRAVKLRQGRDCGGPTGAPLAKLQVHAKLLANRVAGACLRDGQERRRRERGGGGGGGT